MIDATHDALSQECRARILVVDDEADVRETFREYLEKQGFVALAFDGGAALRDFLASGETAALVLLDLSMPGEDGLSLARFLRETTSMGVIMVTASDEPIDRIVGLEVGADDYIAKPVNLRELLARVKAVLRRLGAPGEAAAPPRRPHEDVAERVAFGPLCSLDLDARALFGPDGEELPVTPMEFSLLKVFVERPRRTLSRDQLIELAHNRDRDPFDRSIDIHIARLRRKIESNPSKPTVLKTVRGAGYMFDPDAR